MQLNVITDDFLHEQFVSGPVIHKSGNIEFYGSFMIEDEMYILEDVIVFGLEKEAPVYMILTISQTKSTPVVVELARLYRPSEIHGGALAYHASKEVIWSNETIEVSLDDFSVSKTKRGTLETRRAFIARSDFPPTAYFYHSPEVYWVDVQPGTSIAKQVAKKPKSVKSSFKRNLLPNEAITKARSQQLLLYDEDTDSNTSPTSYPDNDLKKTKDIFPTSDLEREDSLLIDLEKSNDNVVVKRNRLRRVASVSDDIQKGSSLEFQASLGDSDSLLLPTSSEVDALRSVDATQESIDSPPVIQTKTKMWVFDDADGATPSPGPLDKDDWVSKQLHKSHKPHTTPTKDGTSFRASLSPTARQEASSSMRTTQLSKNSAHLNNYELYALDSENGDVTTVPPISSPKSTLTPSKPLRSSFEKNQAPLGTTIVDGDDDDGFKTEKAPTSPFGTPTSSAEHGTALEKSERRQVKAWRPPGPRQTKISFPKAGTNALDSAVVATSALSPSVVEKATTPQSSSKRKAIRPLTIGGMAPIDASQLLMSKGRSKPSASKSTPIEEKSPKKRVRQEPTSVDDDDDQLFAEIGIPATGPYKLRKLAPELSDLTDVPMERLEKKKKATHTRMEVDEEDSGEMDDFIVGDDEEIEFDDKIRFVDEEPVDSDLDGYLNADSLDANGQNREFFSDLATLDMKTAFMRYLQYLISSVINPSFASTWAGQGSSSDEYFKPALRKIRNKVCSIKDSLISSSVWSSDLKDVIDTHPIAGAVTETRNLGVEAVCRVCRRKHVSTRVINISGPPYDCEAYWNGEWEDNPSETAESELESFRAGSTCSNRVLRYHQLQHLQYYIVQHIKPHVARARQELAAKGSKEMESDEIEVKLLETVMAQEAWLEELHLKFDNLIESSIEFGIRSATKNSDADNDNILFLSYDAS